MEDIPPGTALVVNTDQTWRCTEFCPDGPFDDGELMWHFEMKNLETGRVIMVTVGGPLEDATAVIGALMGTAGLIGESVGAPVSGVIVHTGKPN